MLLCCVLLCNLLLTQGNLAHLKGLPRHTFTSREEQRGRSFLSEREELRKSSREALPDCQRSRGAREEGRSVPWERARRRTVRQSQASRLVKVKAIKLVKATPCKLGLTLNWSAWRVRTSSKNGTQLPRYGLWPVECGKDKCVVLFDECKTTRTRPLGSCRGHPCTRLA